MRVNPSDFFKFCASHVPLLRALCENGEEERSDTQLFDLIRRSAAEDDEGTETTLRNLKRLRVVVETEQDSGFYLPAGPVVQLLNYLLHEASPATSEMVRGFINALDHFCGILRKTIESDDPTQVEMAVQDVSQTLRRIYDAVSATHDGILAAVAEFKTDRRGVSVQQKFRRIVYWMEVYVMPMIEIIRVDGVMEATFAETERLLGKANEESVFTDLGATDRSRRFIRLVRRHALRVFEQCRKEIQPLYQSLARSNNIAAGAAVALERLRRDGFAKWGNEPLVPVFTLRQQYAVSDAAIRLALERSILQPPESAPVVNLSTPLVEPLAMRHRRWLNSLPNLVAAAVPLEDLLGWLIEDQQEELGTSEILSGFSTLLFHEDFRCKLTSDGVRTYETAGHLLKAHPVRIESAAA